MKKHVRSACVLAAWFAISAAVADLGVARAQEGDEATTLKRGGGDWPRITSPMRNDSADESWIASAVARMTLEEKVGQMTQAEIRTATPDDVRTYHLGSVFGTGGYWPNGNKHATAAEWIAMADTYWDASLAGGSQIEIPLLIGTDIVHGPGNVYGATLFPHQIGLGAARDLSLISRIALFEAIQLRAIGQNWAFGPNLGVARDDRWSRTYESFSENPALVRQYAEKAFQALQLPFNNRLLGVLGTAKQFIGDGGTLSGIGTSLNPSSEREMIDVFGQPFFGALGPGAAQAIMLSPTFWRNARLGLDEPVHGSPYLINTVLRDKMGFDGLVLSDWGGIDVVPGCSSDACAPGINAGIDMFMVPLSWRMFIENTIAQVKAGLVPIARIDEAVTRILRVKLRAGLFHMPKPSLRSFAGDPTWLVNRPLAREAVRKSLVLLKNDRRVLPLSRNQKILVVGKSADSIPNQTGGWTLTYSGESNTNADFHNAQSILSAIKETVGSTRVTFSETGDGVEVSDYDVVIAVVGETPYTSAGEIATTSKPNPDDPAGPPVADYGKRTLEWGVRQPEDRAVLHKIAGKGVPVITVYVAGRPLYANHEINLSDAFVAAWLPGSEGGGIADMLFRKPNGSIRWDFTGKLSFSWPRSACQTPLNVGSANYRPLFPYGYGLTSDDRGDLPWLDETPGPAAGCP